jgi:integrase
MPKHTVVANEIALRALQCPSNRARVVYHLDGHGNNGLKLFVESTGTKTWYFRARVQGSSPKDLPLGRWPDVTVVEARRRKATAVANIANGVDPWQQRAAARRRRQGITLDEVFAEWAAEIGSEKRTIDQDRLRYAMNIKGGYRFTRGKLNGRIHKTGIGNLAVAEITRLDISNCLTDVRRRSASQAHASLILLNTVLKWARQMGFIDANPAEDQPFRLKRSVRDRYLSEDEIRVLWRALEADPHIMPTTRICLRLLLLTGARREDWAEAPKSELKDGCLVVAAARYKSKRIHRIPLCAMAQVQVNAALRLDPKSLWLFPSLGAFGARSNTGRINERSLTEAMTRLVARLGMEHATPHTLRHTVGSHLDRLGFDLNEIGLALGHKARGVTAGYVHDTDDRRAAERRRPILEAWETELQKLIA